MFGAGDIYTSFLTCLTFIVVLAVTSQLQEQRAKGAAVVTDLKPPPAEKVMVERVPAKNGSVKQMKSPITATSYTIASLQGATNSFSQEFLIGEGSLGRVYKGEFPNGKVTFFALDYLLQPLKSYLEWN